MALKPSKISSELVQTCNRFFSSGGDIAGKLPVTLVRQTTEAEEVPQAFRYRIANTEKPRSLPPLIFEDEEGACLFAELQPSANPEFRFEFKNQKWAERPFNNSPFPASIKPSSRLTVTYNDRQKAEDKLVKCKLTMFSPFSRNFSTLTARCDGRAPADNSGSSANCKEKLSGKCNKVRRQCKVGGNKDCPKLKLLDCEQSKGSNCKLNYLDPHCVKKFAPYPSYSESCAENLPDDPSECHQCPWRTCDGASSIEPGKPVRHKRDYSTSCALCFGASAGIVMGPLLPPPLGQVQGHICGGKCGVTKGGCKQPTGVCEIRRQKEEKERNAKKPQIPERPKKKAAHSQDRMVLAGTDDGDGQGVTVNPYPVESDKIGFVTRAAESTDPWFYLVEGAEAFLAGKKNKYPVCDRKRKPKRPKENIIAGEGKPKCNKKPNRKNRSDPNFY